MHKYAIYTTFMQLRSISLYDRYKPSEDTDGSIRRVILNRAIGIARHKTEAVLVHEEPLYCAAVPYGHERYLTVLNAILWAYNAFIAVRNTDAYHAVAGGYHGKIAGLNACLTVYIHRILRNLYHLDRKSGSRTAYNGYHKPL